MASVLSDHLASRSYNARCGEDSESSDEEVIYVDSSPSSERFPFKRSPLFFIDDGSVILRVSGSVGTGSGRDTLYKVHRYFLERDSEFFRGMFMCPPGEGVVEGMTEETAIPLPDVSSLEVECLLSFLYHGMYERKYKLSEWTALLSISSRYMFDKIRQRAIQEIITHDPPLDPVERVVLSVKHDIPEWLKPAYVEICSRPDQLSDEEAQRLGLMTVVRLARAREMVLRKGTSAGSDSCSRIDCRCCRNARRTNMMGSVAAADIKEIEKVVEDVFYAVAVMSVTSRACI